MKLRDDGLSFDVNVIQNLSNILSENCSALNKNLPKGTRSLNDTRFCKYLTLLWESRIIEFTWIRARVRVNLDIEQAGLALNFELELNVEKCH